MQQEPTSEHRVTVLVAVDAADSAAHVATVAHRTFGDEAEYLVINVSSPDVLPALGWGTPTPMMMPLAYPLFMGGATSRTDEDLENESVRVADAAATTAQLPDAEPLAGQGDVASAILAAAREHDVDVIVVGSHEHGWFDRLLHGSVAHDVLDRADVPVLLAPSPPAPPEPHRPG